MDEEVEVEVEDAVKVVTVVGSAAASTIAARARAVKGSVGTES